MNEQPSTLRTHSRRGIVSFVIAVIWIPVLLIPMNPRYGETITLMLFSNWLWVGCPLGVLLGYRGLRERTRSQTYASLGIVMNSVLFVALIVRIFLR